MNTSVVRITTESGRAYTVKQMARDPLVYTAYYRDAGEAKETYLFRDGRTMTDAIDAVKFDILAQG